MIPIDYNPIIIALIGLISTVIVTLIPVAVNAFFNAQTAKLTKLKTAMENNEVIAQNAVLLIQQTYGALANSVKLQLAFQRASALLNLPDDTIRDLLNTAVGAMKLAWGTDWDLLGSKPEPALPTPPTDPDTLPLP